MRCVKTKRRPPCKKRMEKFKRKTSKSRTKFQEQERNANKKQKDRALASTTQIKSPGPMPVGKSLNGRPSIGLLNSRLWKLTGGPLSPAIWMLS